MHTRSSGRASGVSAYGTFSFSNFLSEILRIFNDSAELPSYTTTCDAFKGCVIGNSCFVLTIAQSTWARQLGHLNNMKRREGIKSCDDNQ